MNKSVGLACNVKTGKLDANQAVKGGAYPFFTCAEYPDEIDHFAFDGDVVLVAGNNAQGNFHVSRFTGKFNAYQRTYVLSAKDGFDIDYIYYALKLELKRLREKSQGSQTKFLTMPILTGIHLQDLNFDEQSSISGVLRVIDAKIDCNNRINAELETMAKTLYDYWFVQFDFPDANGKPYKSSGGKMVFNAKLKREIPEGWSSKKIGEYAAVLKGDLITEKDTQQGDFKVVAAGVDFSYKHSEFNRPRNTITISGSGANAGFINFWREPIFASDCITVRGATDTETLLLLCYLKVIQNHIFVQATGSAQPHVYPDDIRGLDYVIPEDGLIDAYGKLAIPMNDQIAKNLAENQQLAQLRDWLLPLLMNGQVTVR